MSEWTHVVGTVYYHYTGKEVKDMFKSYNTWALYKKVERGEMTEEEYDRLLETINVPNGSEGPLTVFESKEYENPDNEFKYFRCVSFYGDLRDYGWGNGTGADSIIEWWKDIHKNMSVRQSVLQIYDEWDRDIVTVNCWGAYADDHNEFDDQYKYKFSMVSIPRVGSRRKNPKNYVSEKRTPTELEEDE